jgi:hypothetical protein
VCRHANGSGTIIEITQLRRVLSQTRREEGVAKKGLRFIGDFAEKKVLILIEAV